MHFGILVIGDVMDELEQFGPENTQIRYIEDCELETLKKEYEEVVKVKDGKECFGDWVAENGQYVRKEPTDYELKPRKELYKSFQDFAESWDNWTWDESRQSFFMEDTVWGFYDWYTEGGRWRGTLWHNDAVKHPSCVARYGKDDETYKSFNESFNERNVLVEFPVYRKENCCDSCALEDVDWKAVCEDGWLTAVVGFGEWQNIEGMSAEKQYDMITEWLNGIRQYEDINDLQVTVVDCHN